MKTHIKYHLIFFLSLNSFILLAQKECQLADFEETINSNYDSLRSDTNLIIKNKKVDDIPYYETYRFTKNKNEDKYILFDNPDVSNLNIKALDYKNESLISDTFHFKGVKLFKLDPKFSGEYQLVLYSKEPDNKCFLISELTKIYPEDHKIKYVENLQSDLLKEYKIKAHPGLDLPLMKEYSYVLTKNAVYYFELEGDSDVKFKLYNNERKEVRLSVSANNPNLYVYHTNETGIYYFVTYKKDGISKDTTLKFSYRYKKI